MIEDNIKILSEFLYNNFKEDIRGITYWKKHKQHICYICRKKGHIAKDCKKICTKCGNMHSNALCVHSIEKELREFTKLLKRASIRDPLKLKMKMQEKHISLQKEIIRENIYRHSAFLQEKTDNFTLLKKHNFISVTERKLRAARQTFEMNPNREKTLQLLQLREKTNLLHISQVKEFKLVKKEREVRDRVKASVVFKTNQLRYEYELAHKRYMRVKNQDQKELKTARAATHPELNGKKANLLKQIEELRSKRTEVLSRLKQQVERRLNRKIQNLRARWRLFNKNKNIFYKRKEAHYRNVHEFYWKKQKAYEAAKAKKRDDPLKRARYASKAQKARGFTRAFFEGKV